MEKTLNKLTNEEVPSKEKIKSVSHLVFSFFGSRCVPSVQ